jgi:hypothetical protein
MRLTMGQRGSRLLHPLHRKNQGICAGRAYTGTGIATAKTGDIRTICCKSDAVCHMAPTHDLTVAR